MTPEEHKALMVGDVVQYRPGANPAFDGCFVQVTEIKAWGVMGFVRVPGETGGNAYVRPKMEDIAFIGKAVWIDARSEDEEGDKHG